MTSKVLSRNNVNVIGNGEKALLFLHGYGCDQSMWRFMPASFSDDYKLVFIDLVGCGDSDDEAYDFEKYNSLEGYADDVLEVCKELNLKNITVVGHSVSASIAVCADLKDSEVFDNLILVCPSPKFINEGDYIGGFSKDDIDELIETLDANYSGWSKAMAPVIMGNPERPELSTELEDSFCRNNPEIARHFARVTFLCDNREDFKKVTTTTLILQSEHDNLAGIQVGEYVHKSIKNSEMVILETSGHCPHLSAPEQTIQAIKSFLKD